MELGFAKKVSSSLRSSTVLHASAEAADTADVADVGATVGSTVTLERKDMKRWSKGAVFWVVWS